jgi:Flp pilus assembly protein CpaB
VTRSRTSASTSLFSSLQTALPDGLVGTVQHLVHRHRRAVIATLLVMAALSGLSAIAAKRSPTIQIVIAANDLPAGHRLTADDLRFARIDPVAAPINAATDVTSLVGKHLTVAVSEREPLTPQRVIGATGGVSAGMLVTSVRLADPGSADLVSTGDRVDVLAARSGIDDGLGPAPDDAARIVASGVRVVGVPRAASSSGGLLGGDAAAGSASGLLLLEVDRSTARALAGAAASARLSVAVRSPPGDQT